MRVIVAGSRTFSNYELLKEKLDFFLKNRLPDVEIISGTAQGADKLGERYAIENNLICKQFPADWTIGKSAGYKRNIEMASYSNCLIAFWDGTSKGTQHMINIAKGKKLIVRVVQYT